MGDGDANSSWSRAMRFQPALFPDADSGIESEEQHRNVIAGRVLTAQQTGQKRAFTATYLEALTRGALFSSNENLAVQLHKLQRKLADPEAPEDIPDASCRTELTKKFEAWKNRSGHAIKEARRTIGQNDDTQYLTQATMLLWTSEVADMQPLFPASMGQPIGRLGKHGQMNLWQQITYDAVSAEMEKTVGRAVEQAKRDVDLGLRLVSYLAACRDVNEFLVQCHKLDERYDTNEWKIIKDGLDKPRSLHKQWEIKRDGGHTTKSRVISPDAEQAAKYILTLFQGGSGITSPMDEVQNMVDTFERQRSRVFNGEQLSNLPEVVRTPLRYGVEGKVYSRPTNKGGGAVGSHISGTEGPSATGPLETPLFVHNGKSESVFTASVDAERRMAELPKYVAAVHHFELVNLPMCIPGLSELDTSKLSEDEEEVLDGAMIVELKDQTTAIERQQAAFPDLSDGFQVPHKRLEGKDDAFDTRFDVNTTLHVLHNGVAFKLRVDALPVRYAGKGPEDATSIPGPDNRMRFGTKVYKQSLRNILPESALPSTPVDQVTRINGELTTGARDDMSLQGGLIGSVGNSFTTTQNDAYITPEALCSRVWWSPTRLGKAWDSPARDNAGTIASSPTVATEVCKLAILKYCEYYKNEQFKFGSSRDIDKAAMRAALTLHLIHPSAVTSAEEDLTKTFHVQTTEGSAFSFRSFWVNAVDVGEPEVTKHHTEAIVFPVPALAWESCPILKIDVTNEASNRFGQTQSNAVVNFVSHLDGNALASVTHDVIEGTEKKAVAALPLLRGVLERHGTEWKQAGGVGCAYQDRITNRWKHGGAIALAGASSGRESFQVDRQYRQQNLAYTPHVYVPAFATTNANYEFKDRFVEVAKKVLLKTEKGGRVPPAHMKGLTPERIREILVAFVNSKQRLDQLEKQRKALSDLRSTRTSRPVDATPEQQNQAWTRGDLNERAKRDAVWSDAIRELDMSGDRLYIFLRQFAGFMHADIQAVMRLDDNSLHMNVRSTQEQRKRLVQSETAFQNRIIEHVLDSLFREAKLRIEPGDPTQASVEQMVDNSPVIINDAVQERLRALASGESNLPYFAATQEIQARLKQMQDKPATLKTLLDNVQQILDSQMDSRIAKMMEINVQSQQASMDYLQQPRVSFVVRLQDAAQAAMIEAYRSFRGEWEFRRGGGHVPRAYDLIEGLGGSVATQFAKLCASHMVLSRGRSTLASAFGSTRSAVVMHQTCALNVSMLVNIASAASRR